MEKEKQTIEWKESWRDEYLGWICGYANAKGGNLYIGKDDNGQVVGIDNANKLLEDLPNKIRDVLGIITDIDLFEENGLEYLEIKVEPYPTPINYKGEYHYRTGSTKQILRGIALNKFLLDKTGIKWDAIPIPNLNIAELDINAIQYFQKKASNIGRIPKNDSLNTPFETLQLLHLIENDKLLKRAAALIFHPIPEKYVTGSTIKIAYFRTDSDLIFQDEISGSLILQAEKTIDLLKTKYTEALIKYSGIQRLESFPYAEMALREAVLNAIIHKDYSSGVPIQIKVYQNKLVIYNTGKLPFELTPEKFLGVHPSIPANPDIANTFFRAGFIESWGRGVQIMLTETANLGLPKPEFNFDFEGLEVTFRQRETKNENTSPYSSLLSILIKSFETPSKEYVLTDSEIANIVEIVQKLEHKSLIIINTLEKDIHLKRKDIMQSIKLTNNTINASRYLEPLLRDGLVTLTIKDRPNSIYQEYILTTLGKKVAYFLKEALQKSSNNLSA